MPNFQLNHNDGSSPSPEHQDNDNDNDRSSPVLLTTISVEESSSQTATDDNLSVRSGMDSDDINKNPDDVLDANVVNEAKATGRRTELKNSLPRDASVDVLASEYPF